MFGVRKDNRRDRYTAISAARASEGSRGMGGESVKTDKCWGCACQHSAILIHLIPPIVNKMSQRPMVSASRHFAHHYFDKVVERTKWLIFVQTR